MKFGIQLKFIIPLSITLLFMLAIGLGIGISYHSSTLDKEYQLRTQTLIESLRRAIEISNVFDHQRIVQAFSDSEGVEQILLISGIDKKIIASSQSVLLNSEIRALDNHALTEMLETTLRSKKDLIQHNNGRYYATSLVELKRETRDLSVRYGAISVVVDVSHQIIHEDRKIWQLSGIYFITMGSILFFAYWLLRKMIIKPLMVLHRNSQNFSTEPSVIWDEIPQDDEIGDLSRALKLMAAKLFDAKEEAEASNRSKSIFLANMSHEIRTPLTATLGQLQLLADSELSDEQRKRLSQANASSKLLLTMLNEILDFSKIEAGKLELEIAPMSISSIIGQIDSVLRVMATQKSLSFTLENEGNLPDFVLGDSTRLTQVLVNLVNNAIKFSKEGGVLLKTRSRLLPENNQVNHWQIDFEVIDTGIGIAADSLSSIFHTFEQAENNTTRKFGGTGLGLSISKNLVHAMGGELLVESELGKGSCFYFSLTLPEVIGIDETESVSISDEILVNTELLQGIHILTAEDNPILQTVIRDLLESRGAMVTVVSNGQEAVDITEEFDDFDLVLMDIQMPIMDGQEATRQIRKQYDQNQLPIIAMTASAMKEDKDMALANGMNEYLVKPIELGQLIKAMADLNLLSIDFDSINVKTSDNTGVNDSKGHQDDQSFFDTDLAIKNLAGMTSIYTDIVNQFLQQIDSLHEKLIDQLSKGNNIDAAKTCHFLKGTFNQLGGAGIAASFANFDKQLRSETSNAETKQISAEATDLIQTAKANLQQILVRLDS